MAHLDRHNTLSNCQFGLCTKHSTVTDSQLLRTVHDFTLSLNKIVQTDATYAT